MDYNESGPAAEVLSTRDAYNDAKVRGNYKSRTKLERLNDMKRTLEVKLVEVNLAISLLEANPEINKIIEALEKAGV